MTSRLNAAADRLSRVKAEAEVVSIDDLEAWEDALCDADLSADSFSTNAYAVGARIAEVAPEMWLL